MKSFLLRAGLFGLVFWLFVTAMLSLPSFRYCKTDAAPGVPGARITLCSAFPEGVNPRVPVRTPTAIIAGAGQTSLILTALTLTFVGLGAVLFGFIRRRAQR
jgi:hypothetical protein